MKNTPNEIIIVLIKIIFFLPILSAKGARHKAPIAIPSTPELNTTPNVSGEIFQKEAIAGAVYEIIRTSIPSTTFNIKQMKMITNWKGVIFLVSN